MKEQISTGLVYKTKFGKQLPNQLLHEAKAALWIPFDAETICLTVIFRYLPDCPSWLFTYFTKRQINSALPYSPPSEKLYSSATAAAREMSLLAATTVSDWGIKYVNWSHESTLMESLLLEGSLLICLNVCALGSASFCLCLVFAFKLMHNETHGAVSKLSVSWYMLSLHIRKKAGNTFLFSFRQP